MTRICTTETFKLVPPKQGEDLLHKIPQLGQLVQQLLQIDIGDLILQTGDERFCLFGIVAA